MEQKITFSDEELAIKALMRCRETMERNLLVLILRLKQATFFNYKFFKMRHYNVNFFRNKAFSVLLEKAFDCIEGNPDMIIQRESLRNLLSVEPLGQVIAKFVCSDFVCCLVISNETLVLAFWSINSGAPGSYQKLYERKKLLDRKPKTYSNISVND